MAVRTDDIALREFRAKGVDREAFIHQPRQGLRLAMTVVEIEKKIRMPNAAVSTNAPPLKGPQNRDGSAKQPLPD